MGLIDPNFFCFTAVAHEVTTPTTMVQVVLVVVVVAALLVFLLLAIACIFLVDCSSVAESMNEFLTEYNSQYIHDDHEDDNGKSNDDDDKKDT